MSIASRSMTAQDLWHMPKDGMRHELVRGELRTMTPSSGGHGISVIKITLPLAQYVENQALGLTFGAETGFILSRNPDTVRAPDLAFVSHAKVPATGIPSSGYWPGAPDLAVEVVSPGEALDEVEAKVEDWINAGTRLVWVVNPRRRTVTVYRTTKSSTILTEQDELDGQDVIPGFRCPVRQLFYSA